MQQSPKQNLFYFFPVLFCFCLPFNSFLLSVLIAGWFIVSFFNLKREVLKRGITSLRFWIPQSFFLVTFVSALLSDNRTEGFTAIEIKASFLVMPYLFFCFEWPVPILKRFAMAFVSGCFFNCLFLLGRATVYAASGHPEYFFYTSFSYFIHASYLAMYLIFAISIIFLFFPLWFKEHKTIRIASFVFVSIFMLCIFLCSSKLGILSFFIVLPILVFSRFSAQLNFKNLSIGISALLIVLFFTYQVAPGPFQRLNSIFSVSYSNIDKTSSESTTVRVLIWQQCAQLIKQNFLFGTGVGDANDALYNAYTQNGLTGALEHRLNAHNQFLQSFVGLGLLGMVPLLMLTLGPIIQGIHRRRLLLFIFGFLVVFNFLVESMLQTSAGVLFFCFFYCFLNTTTEKELSLE